MIKLYSDTHIPKQVAVQLRQSGLDIVRCEEVDMADATDEQHWNFAQEHQSTILTHDDDFLKLANQAWINNEVFYGVIYGSAITQGKIGLIVKTCIRQKDNDLTSQVIYITTHI